MKDLNLRPIKAYTVNSSDDEMRSSDKGTYRTQSIAEKYAKGSGWYGSNGTVKSRKDVYEDENGILYSVKLIGRFTDEEEKHKTNLLSSIKSKLTKEELEFLKSDEFDE